MLGTCGHLPSKFGSDTASRVGQGRLCSLPGRLHHRWFRPWVSAGGLGGSPNQKNAISRVTGWWIHSYADIKTLKFSFFLWWNDRLTPLRFRKIEHLWATVPVAAARFGCSWTSRKLDDLAQQEWIDASPLCCPNCRLYRRPWLNSKTR